MKRIKLKVYSRNDSNIAKENFALGWAEVPGARPGNSILSFPSPQPGRIFKPTPGVGMKDQIRSFMNRKEKAI